MRHGHAPDIKIDRRRGRVGVDRRHTWRPSEPTEEEEKEEDEGAATTRPSHPEPPHPKPEERRRRRGRMEWTEAAAWRRRCLL